MEFISTTATAVEKLKRLAKTLRKTTKTSLAVAQDEIARQNGYLHWKHVTVCQERTSSLRQSKPLPDELKAFLDETASSDPALSDTKNAFAQGFVFAMDVKDAESMSLLQGYEECDDGWHIAAMDLWRGLIHYRDDETGTTLYETQAADDLLETALDDVSNYRLFRYSGATVLTSLEAAYQQIQEMSFFPPTHIWLGGKFIDINEVPEIRVGGQVVLSNTAGGKLQRSANSEHEPLA